MTDEIALTPKTHSTPPARFSEQTLQTLANVQSNP